MTNNLPCGRINNFLILEQVVYINTSHYKETIEVEFWGICSKKVQIMLNIK
jgi:hypothetical protein